MNKLKFFALLIVCNMVFLFHLAAASAETLSIPASALLPKDDTVTWTTNGANFFSTTSHSPQNFYAPVYLPDGAIIRSVALEAYDNSGGATGGYVQLEFLRYQYNTVSFIADINTDQSGAPGDTRVVLSNIDRTADNSNFSFGISVIFHPGFGGWPELAFYRVVIEYDVPQVTISG